MKSVGQQRAVDCSNVGAIALFKTVVALQELLMYCYACLMLSRTGKYDVKFMRGIHPRTPMDGKFSEKLHAQLEGFREDFQMQPEVTGVNRK